MTSPITSSASAGGLLSQAESRAARELRRWSGDELERVAGVVVDALASDAQRWGAGAALDSLADAAALRGAARAVHAEDVEPAARPADWEDAGVKGVWWHAGEPPVRRACRALFGDAGSGPGALDGLRVSDELAAELWAGQLRAVATLVATDRGASGTDVGAPAQAWRRWSGAVLVTLSWCGAALQLLFAAEAMERLLLMPARREERTALPPGSPPVPALRALMHHRARLVVRLDPFDIDLGSLVSLNVGDVLRVRHALDKPAHVWGADAPLGGEPLCAAWLGQHDGLLAVELVRSPAATEPSRAKSHS